MPQKERLDMMFPNEKIVESVRAEYPEGTRVKLVKMDDVQAPAPGTTGTVKFVDDTATVHIAWDTGSSLGAVYGEDIIVPIRGNGQN